MKVEEEILQKAKFYMESKSYDTEVVRENEIKKLNYFEGKVKKTVLNTKWEIENQTVRL